MNIIILLSSTQKKKFLVSSAINILHNCSKASENRQIFCDLRAKERIAPFLKADDMEIVLSALLTLAYITSDEQKKLLEAESRVCISSEANRKPQTEYFLLRLASFNEKATLIENVINMHIKITWQKKCKVTLDKVGRRII